MRGEDDTRIPIPECVKGRVYRLRCRNLKVGVYDGDEGFIGIRTKFGSRYLFTEYHWDQGPPHGTVSGIEDTGVDLPEDIEPVEAFEGTVDGKTGRRVVFEGAIKTGGKGWCFEDTGQPSKDILPHRINNPALFEFLDEFEVPDSV